MTYRSKSDFPFPWGFYVKRKNSYDQDIEYIIKNKTKKILWLVSKCNNKRDALAYYFQGNGLEIDVHGKCADRIEHQKHCKSEECFDRFNQYKFYFPAENSFCKDYIIEKYRETPFQINAVPTALGVGNYSDSKLAVPGSYINEFDFESLQELVKHMKKVDEDIDLYKKYFDWKKQWKVINTKEDGCKTLCEICKGLHEGKTFTTSILSQIDSEKECNKQTEFFNEWIRQRL